MAQLDTTGVATPFYIVGQWLSSDVQRDEAAIHKILAKFRTRTNREWFSVPDQRTDQLVVHLNRYIKRANQKFYDLTTEMPDISETSWERLRGLKRLSIKVPKNMKRLHDQDEAEAGSNLANALAHIARMTFVFGAFGLLFYLLFVVMTIGNS